MEIKRHRFNLKIILAVVYFVCFGLFLNSTLSMAEATQHEIDTTISIPSIALNSDVTKTSLSNGVIAVPDYIVGSYSKTDHKTLLVGHSSTVFSNLSNVRLYDEITYDGSVYVVSKIDLIPKEKISMAEILSGAEKDTLVLMTCAGKDLPNLDSTHRLIITAVVE